MRGIDLSGQVALVTGAARGIGRAVARALGEAGAGLALADVQAEPLTNYFVGRAQHSVGSRASVGLLTTMVHRADGTEWLNDLLVGQAYVGGLDGHVFLDGDHEWVISGGLAGSSLHGTAAAVDRVQRASQRYLQRPDAENLTYDPTRTSLSGWTGNLNLNRNRGNVSVIIIPDAPPE